MDIRHKKRVKIVQELYSFNFSGKSTRLSEKTKKILKSTNKINKLIEKGAPRYKIDKISKTDLAILTLAVYELVIEANVPPKVVINEAIELAHELAGQKSPAFINASLGKIYQLIQSKNG